MRRLAALACSLLATLATTQLEAQTCGQSCDDTPDGLSQRRCMSVLNNRHDQELTAVYDRIRKRLTVDNQDAVDRQNGGIAANQLRQAQLFWIKYRDAKCSAEAYMGAAGGTAASMVALECYCKEVVRRSAELSRFDHR